MTCDRCGQALARLQDGRAYGASIDGALVHIDCALPPRQVAANFNDDDTPPPEPMRYAPGELSHDEE